jgi:F-type H+-transporting ATPase subunit a
MFRLYGNIMAGHILVAVFLGLGLGMLKGLHVPFGVPLHFPFLFLEILVGTIQAFVFALLTTVYIAMMLPHDDHSHEEAHAH